MSVITEVYDIETITNLFTYTSYCLQDNTIYQFVIHKSRNQSRELYEHLKRSRKIYQVGYNNEEFDYPVLHYFLLNYNKKYKGVDGETIATDLYRESQRIINSNDYVTIWDNQKFIHQTDLFKIWHFNSPARLTSLKDLQFAMQMKNIQEMPIGHDQWVKESDIDMVLDYNKNDVEATYLFLLTTLGETDHERYKGRNKIQLRADINSKFRFNCHNLADVPLGERLMLTLYSRAIGSNVNEIRHLRTHRSIIHLKDCIPSWIKINTPEFNRFIEDLKNTSVVPGGEFKNSVIFHGIKFDFGLGGSHGCIKAGVYDSDDEGVLYDMDIASHYPSTAKSIDIYPAHLGPKFMELYSGFIEARMAEKRIPKNMRDNVLMEGYKLVLNGVYGKTGDKHSWLYDPLYMYKTTIAGQLFIAMWAERMVEAVPELTFIQINTDGMTIKVKEDDISKIKAVNEQLTKETSLIIEDTFYDKMVMRDVNNYLSVYRGSTAKNEEIKAVGCFDYNKEFHKDSSQRIVPLALKEYFVYGIPIEQTIKNHDNIFDFCLRLKINRSSLAFYNFLSEEGLVEKKELSRTTRYFISNKGGSLTVFYNGSDNQNRRHIGYVTTLFNEFYESDDYNINYDFYATETRKILNTVEDNQLSLF